MKTRNLLLTALALFIFAFPAVIGAQESTPPAASSQPKTDTQADEKQTNPPENGAEQEPAKEKPLAGKEQDSAGKSSAQKSDQPKEEKAKPAEKPSKEQQDADSADQGDEQGDSGKQADETDDDDEGDADDDDESEDDDQSNRRSSRRSLFGGDDDRNEKFSRRSQQLLDVFEPIVTSASTSTVKILAGDRQVALGTVVDANGFILTKASELQGEVVCKFADGRELVAKVLGVHEETDLAMLQVDTENLNVVQWSDAPTPVVGYWLATPNLEKNKLAVGVVGVAERTIPPSSAFIGITMTDVFDTGDEDDPDDDKQLPGVKILSVVDGSPAKDAGLKPDDVILKIDDTEIEGRVGLQETMKSYQAEDRVELSIVRDDQNKKIRLTLGERDKISPLNVRSNTQNNMGSVLSKRRKDFPNAFQHDAMLTSKAFGGPVVGLDGRVVGINIARAGRVANFSLPTHTVLPIISELKSGKLAPELVNRERITEIDAELKEISKKLAELPEKKIDLELRYKVEQAKKIELEKMLKEIEERLESVNEDHDKYKSEFYSARDDLDKLEKDRQRLKETRKKLATGVGSDSLGKKR